MARGTTILGAGASVGGYIVHEVLGDGGTGTVYRATSERLRREVAVKVIHAELAQDPTYRARFERETRIAAQLEHPNVVPIEDFGEHGGNLYVVMRFVHGHDLKALLGRVGAFDPAQTLTVVGQTAAALDEAHAHDLVHRDVKPTNILVTSAAGEQRGAHVYLTGFGVAEEGPQSRSRSPLLFLGTHAYASPEQIDGKPLDGRADQYSLACVAYECLTGTAPFDRPSDSAIMLAHLLDVPPSAHQLVPALPAAVDSVLAAGLAKNPADRFPSCAAFAEHLRAALEEGVGVAVAPPPARGTQDTTPSTPRVRAETELAPSAVTEAVEPGSEERRSGVGRLVAIAAAIAGLTVLAAGLIVHLQSSDKTPPASSAAPVTKSDTVTLAGEQRYVVPATRFTRNDRGTALTVVGIAGTRPLHGLLTLDRKRQRLVYRPELRFRGAVPVRYTVSDESGNRATGKAVLHVSGFTAAQLKLLAEAPASVRASCSATGASSIACTTPAGALVLAAYSSAAAAGGTFKQRFSAPAGTCRTRAGTGTWAFAGSRTIARGRYGCKFTGDVFKGPRPVFGWTYTHGRYLGQLTGARNARLASTVKWFFAQRFGS